MDNPKDKLDELIEVARKLGRIGVCWDCGIYGFVRFGEEDTELGRCTECGRPFFDEEEKEEWRMEENFAQSLGFDSWHRLLDASVQCVSEGDIGWFITRLPDGRWAAWDDVELASDRVEFFSTREEAIKWQRDAFEASELPEECWLL